MRNGKLTTIVFIRERNSKGQEVSGYIDFAFRLKVRVFSFLQAPVRQQSGVGISQPVDHGTLRTHEAGVRLRCVCFCCATNIRGAREHAGLVATSD